MPTDEATKKIFLIAHRCISMDRKNHIVLTGVFAIQIGE